MSIPLFSPDETVAFDNAPDMIEWLRRHLEEAILICLDHDLGPNRNCNGKIFDPGTGRDVADHLANRKPSCPVLVHTTNGMAAPGMMMVLDDSGWPHRQVLPYNDLEWVREVWIEEVKEVLKNSSKR